MASLTKDSAGRSKYWICCYTAADGRQLKRSTKQTEKSKAWEVCLTYERTETMVRNGLITEAQLRKVLSATLERVTGETIHAPSIREWLDQWLKSRQGTASDTTLMKYNQVIRDFTQHLGRKADVRLEAISPADFISFRDKLLDEGRTPQTVNQLVRKVLAMPFILAWKQGHIRSNPLSGLPPLRTDQIEKGTFTIEEISKLLSAASLNWKGAILVAYYTGARLKDACNLRWENIDLANGSIRFVVQKTQQVLVVAIHPQLQEHLLSISELDNPNAFLFPMLAGKSGTGKSGLSAQFKRLMEKAGVGAGMVRGRKGKAGRSLSLRSFHSLRHSFNSAMANAGVPQEIRCKLVGHASDVMNSRYTHHEIETLRKAISAVPRLAGG
jgi:integrase